MSETTTETAQDTVQEVAPQSQNEEPTNPEVGNLIAESKKYRSRAQEAESKLAELRASLELDSMKSDYERLKGAELAYKEELLNSLGEDERETFKDLSVSQLRALSEKLKIETQEVPSTSSTPARTANTSSKSWVDMSNEERRANWGAILQSYVKR